MKSLGLIAGLAMPEILAARPGEVMDLFVYRLRYDDIEHGIKRQRQKRCED